MPPQLSHSLLPDLALGHYAVDAPDPRLCDLPERVVQFGTGRFLRGFVDYFIDKANRSGRFGGRVVAVSSTGSGRGSTLDEQDGLYTLVVRGLEGGQPVERFNVCSAISRSVSARTDWQKVLEIARSPEIVAVVSNTTEVGIVLDGEDAIDLDPPRSFPGKLTAFLFERAKTFDYAPDHGLVILPCELIEDNGAVLGGVVRELSERWGLPETFREWLDFGCVFCNTLVDRIVTGLPASEELDTLTERLGYRDKLLTVAEVYRLYAVEGGGDLVQRVPFLEADKGIIVTDDVHPFRQRKVRILNGTHTIMVPAALLAGLDTVGEAVADPLLGAFVRRVMFEEIVPSLDVPGGAEFGAEVLDRFANPFVEHPLLNITLQSTMKMRLRIVPSIVSFHDRHRRLPQSLLFGFACYLLFMRASRRDGDSVMGERKGKAYTIEDDHAVDLFQRWQGVDVANPEDIYTFVHGLCGDADLWGYDLTELPGLVDTVTRYLIAIHQDGARRALAHHFEQVS